MIGKRLRIRLRDGTIQEIPATDSPLPDGATLLAVHVPLFMKDAALREFASFPNDSDSEENEQKREHDRLLGQREGAYLSMKEDIATGYMSEEQKAAKPKTIAP